MKRRLILALAGVAILAAAGGAWAYFLADQGPSLCAMYYAETGDEQYRGASWWTCYRAQQRHRQQSGETLERTRAANAVANAAELQRRAEAERASAAQDAKLIAEMGQSVCNALERGRHGSGSPDDPLLDVDLIGLSGHGSLFAIEGVCRNCADMMGTFYDSNGQRFCDVGGIAGKTCEEAKAFPHTGSLHREGTREALMKQFGCRSPVTDDSH